VVFFNPAFYEMLLEKFEKEITLSASPYSSDDFYEVVVLCVDYAFEQEVSLDGHNVFSVYKYLDFPMNLKREYCTMFVS
jgi:hypothetical protein